jgi:hypothetical protein
MIDNDSTGDETASTVDALARSGTGLAVRVAHVVTTRDLRLRCATLDRPRV